MGRPLALEGARVLVTGASSGIGAAVVSALGQRGARLACTGRDPFALAAAGRDHGAFAVIADLTEPGGPETVVEAAAAHLGGLDAVVSCAGAGWAGPFEAMTADELDAQVDLNFRAPLHLAWAALPYLRANTAPRAGRLVLMGSIAGQVGVPGEAAYSATKAGVRGLADALRGELAPAGIAVTLVIPAVVETSFFKRRNRPYERRWPRPIPAERAAAAIVAGVEDGRPEVIIPPWLTVPTRLHGALPGLYRYLAGRLG